MDAETLFEPTTINSFESTLSSRWQRLGASCIDAIIAFAYGIPILFFFVGFERLARGEQMSPMALLQTALLSFLGFVLVHSYFLNRNGQTVGKKIVGIRIVAVDGKAVGMGTLLGRRYLPISLVAAIPAVGPVLSVLETLFIFRSDRRCVHDLIAGTQVVNARAKPLSALWIVLLIIGIPFLLGFAAAIALPGYQQYLGRAHAAQEQRAAPLPSAQRGKPAASVPVAPRIDETTTKPEANNEKEITARAPAPAATDSMKAAAEPQTSQRPSQVAPSVNTEGGFGAAIGKPANYVRSKYGPNADARGCLQSATAAAVRLCAEDYR